MSLWTANWSRWMLKQLEVLGNTILNENLIVKGTSNLQGNVDCDNNLNVDGNLSVVGNSTFRKIIINNPSPENSLTVNGAATFLGPFVDIDGQLACADIISTSKDMYVGKSLFLTAYKEVASANTIDCDDAVVVKITGTTNIKTINNISLTVNKLLILKFDDTCTVENGTGNISLGQGDFISSAGSILFLVGIKNDKWYGVTSSHPASTEKILYTIHGYATSLTDNETVYLGNYHYGVYDVEEKFFFVAPFDCIVNNINISIHSTTAGSNESWELFLNVIGGGSTSIDARTLSTHLRVWENFSLGVPLSKGDMFNVKSINPSWDTNPSNNGVNGYIVLEKT